MSDPELPVPSPAVPSTQAAAGAHARARDDGTGRGALLIAAGILASKVVGLAREVALSYFFGLSGVADAFRASLRVPNFLQNLFGEGVLSASFIPVYAQLLAQGDEEEADHVAGAVFGLLAAVLSILVAVGILATPAFIDLIAPGFEGETRALTVTLVRILFPATATLVLSAWCLGILNSHRHFFISYIAPVAWNAAIIGTLLIFGRRVGETRLAVLAAYGSVLGSVLQLGIQVRPVWRLLGHFRPSVSTSHASVRRVLRSFGPVVVSRGVVQISAYIDMAYATLVAKGAVAALSNAQTLYLLPISLFGMAVSAAELPAMSSALGTQEEIFQKIRARIDGGSARIAFFVVPSSAAFLLLGDIVGGALFQHGRFTGEHTRYLWYLLMGSTVGLVAATLGRLYSSAFYALKDTRTPLLFASLRVVLTIGMAYWSAVRLPGELGVPHLIGGVGITATTGVAAWVEFLLLRRTLERRVGKTGIGGARLALLWGASLAAGAVGLAAKWALLRWRGPSPSALQMWHGELLPAPAFSPILTGIAVLVPFGLAYFAITAALGIPEARATVGRVLRRRVRK